MIIPQVLIVIAVVFWFIAFYNFAFGKEKNPANYSWSGFRLWSWWFKLGWFGFVLWAVGLSLVQFVK